MASKLTLKFTGSAIIGQSITLFDGATYTFKNQRLGTREVTAGNSSSDAASNFFNAFKADDNYLSQFIVGISFEQRTTTDELGNEIPGELTPIVTIEHSDNEKFSSRINGTSFISVTSTSTPQGVDDTFSLTLGQSPTNACGKFNIGLATNKKNGRITIELPVGNKIDEVVTDISGAFTYNLDRVRPASATQGVVKLYETEFTTKPLRTIFFNAPGVLAINEVKINASPFGAVAMIEANGSNLTYSLDGVSFQSSKEYTGLLAGSFTAYAKDSFGCTKSLAFTVTEADVTGLSVEPMIKVPIHNSIRFADRDGETFINFLASETPSFLNIKNYYQDYLLGDSVRIQFKSSYPSNRVYGYDCDGNEVEIAVLQKSNNISRKNIIEGNYTDYEGRLAVYFDAGNVYNLDGSVKETHNLSGLLPDWYEEGMFLNIEGVGVTMIDRIVFDEDAEIKYAVTLQSASGTGLGSKITSIHTAHPYEVFEFDINFLETGKFMFKLDYGSGMFLSEPIKVWDEMPRRYLKVEWTTKDNNDILYGTGISHMRRLQWSKYFSYLTKSEKETFYSDTTLGIVKSKSHSTYALSFMPMPMELARGLDFGFNAQGAKVIINGAVFVCDGAFKVDEFGSMQKVGVELTLADQSMKGQQNVTDAINAEFLIIERDVNGVKFLRL